MCAVVDWLKHTRSVKWNVIFSVGFFFIWTRRPQATQSIMVVNFAIVERQFSIENDFVDIHFWFASHYRFYYLIMCAVAHLISLLIVHAQLCTFCVRLNTLLSQWSNNQWILFAFTINPYIYFRLTSFHSRSIVLNSKPLDKSPVCAAFEKRARLWQQFQKKGEFDEHAQMSQLAVPRIRVKRSKSVILFIHSTAFRW